MAINFTGAVTAYELMIDNFGKTISRTPATKTTSNLSGNETLTEGTPVNITGTLFRERDKFIVDNPGLLNNADAVLMVKTSVTINKDDTITYAGETFRVDDVVTRKYNGTSIYKAARCFLI